MHFGFFSVYVEDIQGCPQGDSYRSLSKTGQGILLGFWLRPLSSTVWLRKSSKAPSEPSGTLCLCVLSWTIPRFLTLFTNGTTQEPICMDVGRSLSELEVATSRASVLPLFSCSLFWTIQLCMSFVQCWMISVALSMLHESKEVCSCISSAKDWCFTGCLAIESERGLVYMINKTGLRTDPWGTLNGSGMGWVESCPNTETDCILPVIYDLSHTSAVPLTLQYDWSGLMIVCG